MMSRIPQLIVSGKCYRTAKLPDLTGKRVCLIVEVAIMLERGIDVLGIVPPEGQGAFTLRVEFFPCGVFPLLQENVTGGMPGNDPPIRFPAGFFPFCWTWGQRRKGENVSYNRERRSHNQGAWFSNGESAQNIL